VVFQLRARRVRSWCPVAMADKLVDEAPPVRLRGKAALRSIQVKHEDTLLLRLYNSYIYALRLPLPFFFLIMFSTPLLLSFLFTAFYLLDVDGLSIPEDLDWGRRSSWWESVYGVTGETQFKVFVFSLSLCTTFGGTGVEARSPYNLLLANLNTLTAQLVFVFLSGAGTLIIFSSTPIDPKWRCL
jgi:inward rectifier potassium channel